MSSTTTAVTSLTALPAWQALEKHAAAMREVHLRDLFAKDPGRASRFSVEAEGLFLDYSKNRITDETMKLLLDLARQSGLEERRDAMFSGDKINLTEDRSVLHVALRAPKSEKILSDGVDVVPEVHAGSGQDGWLRRSCAQRRMEGFHRQEGEERY